MNIALPITIRDPIPLSLFQLSFSFRIFRFKNKKRGLIKFSGNILFTHFGEIGAPEAMNEMAPNDLPAPPIDYIPPPSVQLTSINTIGDKEN